jgi:SAM-dependent methyltransferase
MFKDTPICPACASAYTLYCQDVIGRRTQRRFPQYFCMDCHSFHHRSGYVEDEQQKAFDFEALYNWREDHQKIQSQLFLELKTKLPWIRTVLEVGHGAGLFLQAVKDFGCEGYGFEVNRLCHDFAREQLGLAVELGYFGPDHKASYDLICSIMVFEHLETPRTLFCHMRDKLNPDGAIYISVPFVERRDWPFLKTAGTTPGEAPPDPFYDNDVHITHFSIAGMQRMGLGLGARSAEFFISKDVAHHSPGSYGGVLFQF